MVLPARLWYCSLAYFTTTEAFAQARQMQAYDDNALQHLKTPPRPGLSPLHHLTSCILDCTMVAAPHAGSRHTLQPDRRYEASQQHHFTPGQPRAHSAQGQHTQPPRLWWWCQSPSHHDPCGGSCRGRCGPSCTARHSTAGCVQYTSRVRKGGADSHAVTAQGLGGGVHRCSRWHDDVLGCCAVACGRQLGIVPMGVTGGPTKAVPAESHPGKMQPPRRGTCATGQQGQQCMTDHASLHPTPLQPP